MTTLLYLLTFLFFQSHGNISYDEADVNEALEGETRFNEIIGRIKREGKIEYSSEDIKTIKEFILKKQGNIEAIVLFFTSSTQENCKYIRKANVIKDLAVTTNESFSNYKDKDHHNTTNGMILFISIDYLLIAQDKDLQDLLRNFPTVMCLPEVLLICCKRNCSNSNCKLKNSSVFRYIKSWRGFYYPVGKYLEDMKNNLLSTMELHGFTKIN